jgi:hypothetical protein
MATAPAWKKRNKLQSSAANDLPKDRQVRSTSNANMPEAVANRIIAVLRYNDWTLSPEAVELRFGVHWTAVRSMLKRRGLLDQYVGDYGWLQDFNERLDKALLKYENKYARPGTKGHTYDRKQWGYRGRRQAAS